MPNTVYGPYTSTTWVDGVTQGGHLNMNNLETQASVALHGINPALSGPFVYSGITCAKDGTIANQLDISSGVAFVTLSDGTTGQITVVADNTHTTATPSTTYYLFLKNDGTWQWSTTSTGPANSLPICQATTDASGNILAVSDQRHNAGSPGVPYVVARAKIQAHTVITDTVYAQFTVPVTGMYRASLFFDYQNPTPQKVAATFRWYDIQGGGGATASFMLSNTAAAGQFLTGTQAATTGNNQACACVPIVAVCLGGQLANVHFQDGGGTPNDIVSVVIERLT